MGGRLTRILSCHNMPAIIMLFFFCCCQLSLSAQTGPEAPLSSYFVTLKRSAAPVSAVFTAIKQQTGLTVFFSNDLLNDKASIETGSGRLKVTDVLDKVLSGKQVSYRLRGKVIVLEKAPQPPANRLSGSPAAVNGLMYVRGKVVDDKTGGAVIGATVMVVGTQTGMTTGAAGDFSLQLPASEATLAISSIGYEAKEVAVNSGDYIVVRLVSKVTAIGETVVTGIVTRKTGSFTGTAVTFTNEQLRTVGNQNVLQSLRALDPSFQVFENNLSGSNPNSLPNIQVRGASNLPDLKGNYTGNPNLPLFILDGFEVSLERIFDLDMNRVEKLTILKDATATALYGSRSANGVVVINTKQPEAGKLRLSYTGDYTFETPDLNSYHLLNGSQKLEAEKAAGLYTDIGGNPLQQQLYDEKYAGRLAEVQRGVNTDWIAQPLRTSFGQRHFIYLEGGDNYLRYAVDLSTNTSKGVMKGSGRQAYAGGVMLSYRHKSLMFRNYLSVSETNSTESPYGSFDEYVRMNPYWRKTDAAGNVLKTVDTLSLPGVVGASSVATSPLYNSTINTRVNREYLQLNNNFSLEWMISEALKLRSNFSMQIKRSQDDSFMPAEHTSFANYSDDDFLRKGSYMYGNGRGGLYEFSSYLDFNRTFGGKHLVYATGGVNLADDATTNTLVIGEGFPSQFLDYFQYAAQYQQDGKPSGNESRSRRISFLGNVNYSYDSRYVADLSVSTDGSSRFGNANKFAPFWAAGIGWNIHNEQWARNLGQISQLKLRASYGATGTQNFPSYMALTTYSYFTDTRYLNSVGAYLLGLGNNELKWQQKKTLNVGTDITLFDNRLALTANLYHERTQNQLIDLTIPPSMGFFSYKENLGLVNNDGYEVNARVVVARNVQQRLTWSINGAIFHNQNKLMKISDALNAYNDGQNKDQVEQGLTAPTLQFKEGQSISAIYAVQSLGIDPATGKEMFLTRNGQRTFTWDAKDKVAVGDQNPDYRGLFGTMLMWQGITLNAVFSYQLGGQMYNQTLVDRVENADLRYNVDRRVLEGRWRTPGDHSFFKNIADNTVTMPTSRFVQDNNEVICESISLQYDFAHQAWLTRSPLKTLRVNLYANQPFRFTSITQERGLYYPFAHTYSFSVQTSF